MFKKLMISVLLLVVMLAGPSILPVRADVTPIYPLVPIPSVETLEMVNETPQLWFVELSSPPTADGTALTVVNAEKASFRSAAKKAGMVYTERYAFGSLWNGLSIRIGSGQLAKLSRIPGVKAIYPVDTIALPPTVPGETDLFTALAMTGADIAQSEMGYTGKGIKVAVMDTGIDYDHADLGGDGTPRENSHIFPTERVAYGYDLVGDDYNADPSSPSYSPVPVPDDYPDDCNGHGTHVAGIIGANGGVSRGLLPT